MKKIKKGYYRHIPIYIYGIYADGGMEFYGRNWFLDIFVNFNLWMDFSVLELEEVPITILEEE